MNVFEYVFSLHSLLLGLALAHLLSGLEKVVEAFGFCQSAVVIGGASFVNQRREQ
jgi:hypothetical protein